jgi:aspartyl-tRNA(Asn)/glutamyl-tRNA(Gln) amidotransferase subunit B
VREMGATHGREKDVEYETVVGLEVHVELDTATKMFCGCPVAFGAPANTHICPVCVGLPGALPRPNAEAVRRAVRMALALGMRIAPRLKFDRKNYFYPDLPKGYQISQYDEPLGTGGALTVAQRTVRIRRLHLEEDAGKLIHLGEEAAVDFNRAGVPLIEIVSEPDLGSAEEARLYMEEIRRIAQFLGVSDVRMEEGSLRADVNVSLRPRGSPHLGTRSEVKNLNSFRAVERAIEAEVARQTEVLRRGGVVAQETRGLDEATGETFLLRRKEEAEDYRYFPEPDLPAWPISPDFVAEVAAAMPRLPAEWRRRMAEAGLRPQDVPLLLEEPARARFWEEAVLLGADPQDVANWLTVEVARLEGEGGVRLAESRLKPVHLVRLLELWRTGEISGPAAKDVLAVAFRAGEDPLAVVEARGLRRIRDEGELEAVVEAVLAENPQPVADVRQGKDKAVAFLVGQVMRKTSGRADPRDVGERIRRRILGEGS